MRGAFGCSLPEVVVIKVEKRWLEYINLLKKNAQQTTVRKEVEKGWKGPDRVFRRMNCGGACFGTSKEVGSGVETRVLGKAELPEALVRRSR